MMRILLLSLLLFSASSPTFAGTWTPVTTDLSQGDVLSIAIAPSEPDRLIVVCRGGGVYRTDDAGNSWTDLTESTGPSSGYTGSVSFSSGDPDFVWLTINDSLLESVDGGETWTDRQGPIHHGHIGIHPTDRLIAHTITSGDSAGIYRTEDGGDSWEWLSSSLGALSIFSFNVDSTDPSSIVAQTADTRIQTSDGGANWESIPTEKTFRTIAWGIADPDIVYGMDACDFYRSTDRGRTFTFLPQPIFARCSNRTVAVSPFDSNLVFAGVKEDCSDSEEEGGAVYRSTNGGQTWVRVFHANDCFELPQEIDFDPSDPDRVFLGTSGRTGFFVSTDGGTTWEPRNSGIDAYGIDQIANAGGTIVARSRYLTLRRDPLNGSWSSVETPFYPRQQHIAHLEPSPVVPALFYECGVVPIWNGVYYIIASSDGGQQWSPPYGELPAGIPDLDPPQFVAAGWDGSRVYAFIDDYGVYRSDDGNESYSQVSGEVRPEFRVAAVDPMDPDRLVAARRESPPLHYSHDGGATWEPRSLGLPDSEPPLLIEYDPSRFGHIAAVFSESGAFESTNNGLSWSHVLSASGTIFAADWDPSSGAYYFSTVAGIESNDERVGIHGTPAVATTVCYEANNEEIIIGTAWRGAFSLLLDDDAVGIEQSPIESVRGSVIRIQPSPSNGPIRISYSNSTNSEDTMQPSSFSIYDVHGRSIGSAHYERTGNGLREFTWDGRDPDGTLVAAGVYWAIPKDRAGRTTRELAGRSFLVVR